MNEPIGLDVQSRYLRAANRLAKWKALFTGWQLGTRPQGDPEADAIRDHREATLMLRVEVSALTNALIATGILTREQWLSKLITEINGYQDALEKRFPGIRATDDGLVMDERAAEWMKGWKP